MSIVKFIKQNKSNANAIVSMLADEAEEGSQEWWDVRAQVVQDWLASNPLNIGVPSDGAAPFIKEQLDRGNRHEKARVKVWKQILWELREIPDFHKHLADDLFAWMEPDEEEMKKSIHHAVEEAHEAMHLSALESARFRTSSTETVEHPGGASRRVSLVIREEDEYRHMEDERDRADREREEQTDDEDDDGLLMLAADAAGIVSGKLLDRQHQWLAQKRSKLLSHRKEKELALSSGLTFAPDMSDSRRSFKMKWPGPDSRRASAPLSSKEEGDLLDIRSRTEEELLKRLAATTEAVAPGKTRRVSLESTVKISADVPLRQRRLSTIRKLAKLQKDDSSSASDKSKKSRRKKDSITEGESPVPSDGADAQCKSRRRSFSSVRAPTLKDLPPELRRSRSLSDFDRMDGGDDEEDEKDDDNTSKTPTEPADPPRLIGTSTSGFMTMSEMANASTADDETTWQLTHPDSPFLFDVCSDVYVPGDFFVDVANGRGTVKLRNGADFQMRTMYRKKDKFQRTVGVSLLVGRLERPPHDEQVITIMFDVDTFTEAQAWEWWKENRRRFIDEGYARAPKL